MSVVCAFTERDWVFDFGVKFYVPEPNVLQEEITRCVHNVRECCLQAWCRALSCTYSDVFLKVSLCVCIYTYKLCVYCHFDVQ